LGSATLVPGWTSLILAVILFGTLNLLMLGILGEYTGRIYSEVKNRPIFLVDEYCGSNGSNKQSSAIDK
jgi:dolichol-phosphate mannosyltransferase